MTDRHTALLRTWAAHTSRILAHNAVKSRAHAEALAWRIVMGVTPTALDMYRAKRDLPIVTFRTTRKEGLL